MKHPTLSPRSVLTRVISMALLLLFCLILTFTAFAGRQDHSSANGDPIREYVEKYKDSQMVKLYLMNPNDADLKIAIRMSMVIDNPERFPEFSAEDVERLKIRLNVFDNEFKQIKIFMENGDTYEVAKLRKSRYQSTKPEQNLENNSPVLIRAQ